MNRFLTRPSLNRFRVHRDLGVLVLVVIGCALPFLSQPFHMDDNFYMDMARSARAHPLFPYDAPYDFGGFHLPDMASHSHPPMQAYLLAAVQRLAGEGEGTEWIYHSVFLVFPVLAVAALYFLSALFVSRPLWPALLLAVCPLVLVMEHTLMTDIPMLAFWLGAVACFLWAVEIGSAGLYVVSSLFLFAAMFTSYQAVALIPLLGFYQIRKRGPAAAWLALLLPLAAMGAWLWAMSEHFSRMVLIDTAGYIQSRHASSWSVLGTKAVALLEYQGWLLIFPLFFLYVFARGLRGRLFAVVLFAAAGLAQLVVPGYRAMDKAIFVAGMVTGTFVTARMTGLGLDALRPRKAAEKSFDLVDQQFLALWYFGVVAYCLILFTEGSARYILPLVPPLLICFFRQLEIREVPEYRAVRPPVLNTAMVASGSMVLTLAWGLFLAQADFEFARIYPRAAADFARLSQGLDSYLMGEWGFRYYFEREGAKPLPADESTVRGASLLARPTMALPYDAPADLESMTFPVARLSFDLKTPFRVMDWRTPAGFYSTGWGWIPFSVSRQSLEIIEIRQVSFMVERLPWAHVASESNVDPWPGYVDGMGRVPAILAQPGTTIAYPWTCRDPLVLTVTVGAANAGEPEPSPGCRFEVRLRDAAGAVRARAETDLAAAIKEGNGSWPVMRLDLPGCAGEGETLEFRYLAPGNSTATGAFVRATLLPE